MKNRIEVIRLNRLDGDGSLKAFCDIALFDAFIIKGLRVVSGKNGIFVGMPHQQGKDGRWYATIRPLSSEVKKVIENAVLEAYAA